jgi:hypothetical protein
MSENDLKTMDFDRRKLVLGGGLGLALGATYLGTTERTARATGTTANGLGVANVLDFGAQVTTQECGPIDATAAFEAALASGASFIWVPAGTYVIYRSPAMSAAETAIAASTCKP